MLNFQNHFYEINQNSLLESQDHSHKTFQKNEFFFLSKTQSALKKKLLDFRPYESDSGQRLSDSQKKSRKFKKVTKNKRPRIFTENSTWNKNDQIKYWKFYVAYLIQVPYVRTSWYQWKKDLIYKKMAQYIGKNPKQCKSKDQHMKSKYSASYPGKDVIEIAVMMLEEMVQMDDQIKKVLRVYNQLKENDSKHMQLLAKRMKTKKQLQSQLFEMQKTVFAPETDSIDALIFKSQDQIQQTE